MEVLAAGAAWALSSACRNVPTAQDWLGGVCPRPVHDIRQLANRLSDHAELLVPGSDGFARATKRWSTLAEPGVNLVVVASTEQDVAEAMKYANEIQMPFQAYSTGHGAITTLGNMKDGIQISLERLDNIAIAQDQKTVTIGGGTVSKSLTTALWAAGKQTVTGSCECVSVVGPGLGGGHGLLQGRHGLVQDQFVSFELVQADGSIHTIDESSDLWWGMRGAGQNFGIVTSAKMKIYDVKHEDWSYEMFIFSGASVEGLYSNINDHIMVNEGKPPVDVFSVSIYINMPEIDPNNSIIVFVLFQEGSKAVDPKWPKPFHDLNPIVHQSGAGPYTDVPSWFVANLDSIACRKLGDANARFPIDLPTFNVQAQREVFDMFNKVTHENPAFNGSAILQEGYSLDGVKAVPDESTAFPWRDDNIVILPIVTYFDHRQHEAAEVFGNAMREAYRKGTGREEIHAYVNYGHGSEKTESFYGYEPWRLEKLRALKKKYDPHGKFGFNAPIV